MKVEAQVHIVPHLKALIYVELGLLKANPGGTFSVCQSFLKKGNLLHKIGFFKTGVVGTVSQPFKIHLNKKLESKQKAIQAFNINA